MIYVCFYHTVTITHTPTHAQMHGHAHGRDEVEINLNLDIYFLQNIINNQPLQVVLCTHCTLLFLFCYACVMFKQTKSFVQLGTISIEQRASRPYRTKSNNKLKNNATSAASLLAADSTARWQHALSFAANFTLLNCALTADCA